MLQTYTYKGNEVTFNIEGETYINATEMAKPFGKRVNDFLNLKSTQAYLEVLESDTSKNGITLKEDEGIFFTRKGNYADGLPQGTWMHELLAIEFAGWLAPEFKLWCNQRIRDLLKGSTSKFQYDYDADLTERVEALEQKLNLLKPKTSHLTPSTINQTPQGNWISIRQYAMWHNESIPKGEAISIAKSIKQKLAAEGMLPRQVPDERYGSIGAYPEPLIEETLHEIRFG